MSTRSTILFCIAGTVIVITSGVLASVDAAFKHHATTTAIVVLALLAVSGVLFALVAPLLPTEPQKLTTAAEKVAGTDYTGTLR
jgi:p-aminobenzoyl-glutamate transporter AbgT